MPKAKTAEKKPVAKPTAKSVATAPEADSTRGSFRSNPRSGQQRTANRSQSRPRTVQNRSTQNRSNQNRSNQNRNQNRNQNNNQNRHNQNQNRQPQINRDENAHSEVITGVFDNSKNGHGILRPEFSESEKDVYISQSMIRKFRIMPGDMVSGMAREPKENDSYWGLLSVDSVNGMSPEEMMAVNRPKFKRLTPVYPNEQIKLEIGPEPLSLRIIDMIAPIGKGQRSLLVSPPKAGKTTMLKNVATGVAQSNPDIHMIAVLVGERPEEVTDIKRHIAKITGGKGEVAASNFDESAQDQVRVAETALNRAKRMVELGKDVMILLDSITRLARAYNLAMPTSGRTLSGGFDPAALFPPKRFFGAARNFEVPGSLTIVGTALVDTGSRMDDLIYEEFKGTGNQEVHLGRKLAERRIYPAIDVQKSGTRRDDLMIDPMVYQSIATLHRMLDTLDRDQRTSTLLNRLKRTKTNKEFLASLKLG